MPFLTINTNTNVNVSSALLEDAADMVAKHLGKPVKYVVVTINSGLKMAFCGDTAVKGALIEMKSIGFKDKAGLAKLLTDFAAERLGAESEYVNIEFVDMPASAVAIGGNLLG